MTFSPKLLILGYDEYYELLQEQSTKEIAPTKESAPTGQRPSSPPIKECSQWLSVVDYGQHQVPSWQVDPSKFFEAFIRQLPQSCFDVPTKCWDGRLVTTIFCNCLVQKWAVDRIVRNRQAHLINGNHVCHHCGLFLGTWYYYNLPKKFKSKSVSLPNGMLVHHFRLCKHHLSIWYYRRGNRVYTSFTGLAKTNLIKQLEAAGAASGLPGDHGFSPHKLFFQYQRHTLPPVVQASGHEPRSASGGQRTPKFKISASSSLQTQLLPGKQA